MTPSDNAPSLPTHPVRGSCTPASACSVVRNSCGVWMSPRCGPCISTAREIATLCIHALGLPDEFITRDKLIVAISPRLEAILDEVSAPNNAVGVK